MAKTIIGVFSSRDDAEDALYELESRGYNPKDVSIVMKDTAESKKLAEDTGATVAENPVSGATTGGLVGALAGLLVGTGVTPGFGALFIGGPLAGGLLGVLTGLGISKEEAEVYEERIREGGILVAVPAANRRVDEVIDVLEESGADQIRAIDQTGADREDTEATYDQDGTYTRPDYFSDPSYYNQIGSKGGQTTEEKVPRLRRRRRVPRRTM